MHEPTRRNVLKGLAATAGAPMLASCSPGGTAQTEVTASATTARFSTTAPRATRVWGYDGQAPGPGFRVTQGTRMVRRFVNRLPVPSTIHWHGLRIDNAMDGVAGLTQTPVPPGQSFTYDFLLRDAGTFWYHPHIDTLEQLARGLSAPLIVLETEPPDTDADLSFLINHWWLDGDGQIANDFTRNEETPRDPAATSHLTVNGRAPLVWGTAQNERLRLRLINGTTGRILDTSAQGLSGWVMALDGMPLARPRRFDRVTMAPAQRVDLLVDVTADPGEEAQLRTAGGHVLAAFPVEGVASASPRPTPGPLPPNRVARPDLRNARRATMRMTGGALGALGRAKIRGGATLSQAELVARGLSWTMDGYAGMPDTPFLTVGEGETVMIDIVNATAEPHGMHLHGHHFHQVGQGGRLVPLRDTILMDGGARMTIAFVADNPGDWMFHCHMLAHQAMGMMSWIRVGDRRTAMDIGRQRSGFWEAGDIC
ncbi:MAG: multicopper oxidase family protein [Alphaproteobacteria bacterium]|nr:multicopper oxidase family protein [Alphaproteobacteria bacterium]NNF71018.1 multicopper oxidase family protein [Paracoccaceae bacterium]